MPGHLVVLSGGLDSTVCMALADREADRPPLALTFDYGQRHRAELDRAAGVAGHYRSDHLVVSLDTTAWGGSALTDPSVDVPTAGGGAGIPVTYVPARNSIFLAVALGVAEARDLDAVWIGVNAIDYSGYPDCRPEFVDAFNRLAQRATKAGVERNRAPRVVAPLLRLSKADVVRLGERLSVPWELTWSCYRGARHPCGACDACRWRSKGFRAAGVTDPVM